MRILTVDDNEMALEMLSRALQEAGHEVEVAHDGVEALEFLSRDFVRMVISDWVMPRMDGLELCTQIRSQVFPGYVYVILLTSRDRTEDIVTGLSAGADDFIIKPFEPAELTVRVRAGERVLSLETRHVAIFALANLAESRDPETGRHLERIQRYARILSDRLAAKREFGKITDRGYVENIYLTSPLHDIGKVGIPDCVLLKPGRLDDAEFQVMKKHTEIGGQTLAAAAKQYPGVDYLRMATDIAMTHHERFDGKGYPRGLAGDAIPLCGRITALADVYDALTSKRVYKEAFTHNIARSILVNESGDHFDPRIVQAFLETEEAFETTREEFSEGVAVG